MRQTDNSWPSYSQDLNPPDYFLRGYLKDRVCENNPQTREDIIRREIRWIPQEMLDTVVDNFNIGVAAVLSSIAWLFPMACCKKHPFSIYVVVRLVVACYRFFTVFILARASIRKISNMTKVGKT